MVTSSCVTTKPKLVAAIIRVHADAVCILNRSGHLLSDPVALSRRAFWLIAPPVWTRVR